MSHLSIYGVGTTIVRANVKPDTSSQQQVALMGQDTFTVNFSSEVVIHFQLGDYCTFIGKVYKINQLPKRTRISTRNIQYSIVMEAEYYDLGKVDYFFLDSENRVKEPVFPLRGTLQDFAELIILNMERVFPGQGWELGSIEVTDYATIDFSAQNCLQILQTLASTFATEYFVEGKTINIFQKQASNGLEFEYGEDKSLKTLTEANQDSMNVITRLYVYGSTKNIAPAYRNGSQRLRIGDVNYIEKNVDQYGVIEQTIIFDGSNGLPEIYPHRTGTVSAVDTFVDADTTLTFEDLAIDFDVNPYLIPGVVAQITFNTGLLSGQTFDISSFDNGTKKFTINKNTSNSSFIVPSELYLPVVGDTYVVTQIDQPQSYIDDAEQQLMAAGQSYMLIHSLPPLVYSGDCNPFWFKSNNPKFDITDRVQVLDLDMGINTSKRIISYTRNFINIFQITFELSDTVKPKSNIVKLLNRL